MLEVLRFSVSAALMTCGLLVLCVGVFGVFRFQYVLSLIVAEGATFTSLKLVLVILMLWITSPVSSHLVCRLEVTTNEMLEKEMEVHR